MKIVTINYSCCAFNRHGKGKFEPENIEPNLCTHINYTYFGISDESVIKSLNPELDNNSKFIERTIALKQQNANLKVLASVGGWNEGTAKYSAMAADAQKRDTFISTSVQFVRKHGFDGLDFDWIFPGQCQGASEGDRRNYTLLLKELNTALKSHGKMLTVSVAAMQWSAELSYDISEMSQYVDYINLITYDFHGTYEKCVGHNASLPEAIKAVDYWLSQGAPAWKLVFGIPFFGRTFRLADKTQRVVGSPSCGAGLAGPFRREPGTLNYNEFCTNMETWTLAWDSTASVPYAYKDDQWLSYENERSIGEKIEFVNSRGLAGVMVWTIDADDFLGESGKPFPLLNAINRHIHTEMEID